MSANGIFSPPANPNDGDGYTFGNLVWRYEADNGVWNIVDGALVGSQGPKGDKGDNGDQGIQGTAGATGATGNPYGFKYTFTTSDPPGAGQIYYQYPGNSSTTIRVNATTSDGRNVYGIFGTLFNASVWIISSTNPNAYWFGQAATVTPSGDNSYITIIPVSAITGSSPFSNGEKINFVYALRGAAGSNGTVGVAGPTGSTGATGPIGGTSGQINFNWNGAASGDANFTINPPNNTIVIGGATATTLALNNRSEVAGGAFSNSQEVMDNLINTGTNSITISAGANIQRFRVTPTNTYTVNVSSSGWEETSYRTNYLGCQTITALIQCMNGKTGQFASDIYVDKGVTGDGNQGNAPVLSGVTGGVDIVTVMRYSNGSTAVKIGFHVAKGMTGSGLAF